MANLKRLATKEDNLIKIESPISPEETLNRHSVYLVTEPKNFAKLHGDIAYKPVEMEIVYKGQTFHIEFNRCINPFCYWYGEPQVRFENVSNKPYRYKIIGDAHNKGIHCNPIPSIYNVNGISLNCYTTAISNWSVAEEIARLVRNNSLLDIEPEYNFHKNLFFARTFS